MSPFGITFTVLAISWLIGRIAAEFNHPVAYAVLFISVLICFGAMVTGIVLLGFML